ncbi:acyltransferase family protein [Hyphomonas jannaschiana]|uniref:Acyltransferase 3 n=1 Tax=Hyphomonas jannaschiana VP2 TaxID=1280952 RepID=A0A059FA57_9PROT|nr:acyltransferase family protein [Hyphomonas jannaschiana]KCZ87489.1 acyltransferase 3 [Hyphomonas jannaschiana VP2]
MSADAPRNPARQDPGAKPGYRADVDGLRAVAVVAVLCFHAGWSRFSGGFAGVDVFFVISGFVIALSLFRDLDAGRFSLSGFFARRARRILPALTVVLLGTLLVSLAIVPPVYFQPFADSLIAASLFVSNLHFWQTSSYFNNDMPFRPLLHTWSLGVEEQFYLAAPVFLLLIQRFLAGRWRLVVALCLVASFGVNLYAIRHGHFDAVFYLPFTRAWEFLLGVLIALLPRPALPRGINEVGTLAGLAMIAGSVLLFGPATPFPGVAALWPCLGAGLVIWFGKPAGEEGVPFPSRLLSWAPVVWTGRISYSLYLVHWPVLVLAPFLMMRCLTLPETVAALGLCVLLAWLVYRFVETPMRRIRWKIPTVLVAAFVCATGTAAVGWAGAKLNARLFAGQPAYQRVPDFHAAEQAWRVGTCLLRDSQSWTDWEASACTIGDGGGAPVLLFGDSFAAHYVPGLVRMGGIKDAPVIEYAMEGCPPTLAPDSPGTPACRAFRAQAVELAGRLGVDHVIVAGSWLEYGTGISMQADSTLTAFKAAGIEVTLVGQSPNFHIPPYMILARTVPPEAQQASLPLSAEARAMNARLARLATQNGAAFLDPAALLCPDGTCPVRRAGEDFYLDYGHFTQAGSTEAASAVFTDRIP